MPEYDPFKAAGFTEVTPGAEPAPAAITPTPAAAPAPVPTPAPAAVIPPVTTPAGTEPPPAQPGAVTDPIPTAAPTPKVEPVVFEIDGEKFESFEDVKKAFSDFKKKAGEDPFANEYIKGLNKAVKDGVDPDVYHRVANIKVDKLSDRDALIMEARWKNPNLSPDEINALVDSDYRLGEDENADNQDVKIARIKAKRDANSAREFLESHRAQSLIPPREKQLESHKAAWVDHIPRTVKQHETITVPAVTGEMSFPIAPEVLKKAEKMLQTAINSGEFKASPDEAGQKIASNFIRSIAIVESLPAIIDHLVSQHKLEKATEQHNPRTPGVPPPPANVSEKRKQAEFIAQEYGIRLPGG